MSITDNTIAIKTIDWTNPECNISKYFKVKEALMLPSFGVLHIPSEAEKINIIAMALRMDQVRELVGKAIKVHCWIRPERVRCIEPKFDGLNYNKKVGGSKSSHHVVGNAVDFHVVGFEGAVGCHQIRQLLLPKLEELGLRMEDLSGGWVHLDCGPVKSKRFFKP